MGMVTRMLKAGGLGLAAIAGLSLAAPAFAQGQCSRATLEDVAERYVKAQHDGQVFALPVGEWVEYHENYELLSINGGVIVLTEPQVDVRKRWIVLTVFRHGIDGSVCGGIALLIGKQAALELPGAR